MDADQTLQGLHGTILYKVANALSAVRLIGAVAPFCDPALSIIADDLEQAFAAAQQARVLSEQLGQLVR